MMSFARQPQYCKTPFYVPLISVTMFKAGQKVVCINANGSQNLVENKIYTVIRCWDDGAGGALLLKEVEPNFGHFAFFPHRFRAVDGTWVDEILCKIMSDVAVDDMVSV
jgi:hypothetical protein